MGRLYQERRLRLNEVELVAAKNIVGSALSAYAYGAVAFVPYRTKRKQKVRAEWIDTRLGPTRVSGTVNPELWLRRQVETRAKEENVMLARIEPTYGRCPGIADFLGSFQSFAIALEMKRPDKRIHIDAPQVRFLFRWVVVGGGIYIAMNALPSSLVGILRTVTG